MSTPAPDRVPDAAWAPGLGLLLTSGPRRPSGWTSAGADFARLDATGCGALWFPDHLFWGHDLPEPMVMAAVAATATERMRIGTGVVQLPLRRTAAVAKAASTLQFVSDGRFVLGVGVGDHRTEYERAGVDFHRRGRLLDAGIAELQRCWSAPDDWYGQLPVPAPIPLWMGGRSAAALARAARVADGWMPVFSTVEQFRAASAELDGLVEQAGRRPGSVTRAIMALASVTGPGWDRGDALAWIGRLYAMDPTRLDRYVITGSASEVATQLARYGAEHVAVLAVSDEPVTMFMELNQAYLAQHPDGDGGDRDRQGGDVERA